MKAHLVILIVETLSLSLMCRIQSVLCVQNRVGGGAGWEKGTGCAEVEGRGKRQLENGGNRKGLCVVNGK